MVRRPNVNVYQDFVVSQAVAIPEEPPCIVGPRQDFLDYSDADDKAKAYVGEYDKTQDTDYLYPDKHVLSTVKQETIKVILDEAKLKYFEKAAGAGSYEFRAILKALNRITTVAAIDADRLSFQDYTNSVGTEFARSAIFDERDVTLGDAVEVTAQIGPEEYTSQSEVIGVVNDKIPAVVGAPVADSNNQDTQAHNVAIDGSAVAASGDTLAVSGTYDGSLKDDVISDKYTVTVLNTGGVPTLSDPVKTVSTGDTTATKPASVNDHHFDAELNDTYTIEVITGGAPGVAEVKVTSIRGDDVAVVAVSAFGVNIGIGAKGLKIVFVDGGSGLLTVGDTWTYTAVPSTARISIYSESQKDDVPSRVFPGFGYNFGLGVFGILANITDTSANEGVTAGDQWKVDGAKAIEIVAPTSSGDYAHYQDLVYTIEVIQGGLWSEAIVSVTSTGVDASGPYTVDDYDTDLPAGTKGALFQFPDNTQGGLVKGDKFTIDASAEKNGAVKTLVLSRNLPTQVLNAPFTVGSLTNPISVGDTTATLSGSYSDTGALSEVVQEKYTVTIVTGGAPATATYKVESESGLDDQAATVISAFGVAHAIASAGLLITFVDGGSGLLTSGDTWEVTVDGTNLSVKLMIVKQDRELPKYRENAGYDTAWESDSEKVTIESAIYLKDPSWNDGNVAIPLEEGKIYITYNAVRNEAVGDMIKIDDRDKIEELIGRISINNPLAYAVDKCMEESNFKSVYYFPVQTDDEDGYQTFLDIVEKDDTPYCLVPLTFDSDIHDLFIAHDNEMSQPQHGKWRRTLFSRERPEIKYLFDIWYKPNSTDEEDFLGTITDYIETTASDYIFVEASEDGSPNFINAGVLEGDYYRTSYRINNQGILEWTDYEIAGVISETTLLLKVGPTSPISTPEKFTIYRNLNSAGMVTELSVITSAINDRRVCCFYPDYLTDNDDLLVPAYYACAAVAGLINATPAHQGLTNYSLQGFKAADRSLLDMTLSDLDNLANAGWFILTQDKKTDPVFVRHQLTTNVTVIEFQELSIGRNVDNISKFFKAILDPMIGIYNINDDTLDLIRTNLEAGIEDLKSVEDTQAGPQLIDARIIQLYQDPDFKDQVRVDMILTIPYPLNNLEVHLRI